MPWTPSLPSEDAPIYLRIARAVVADVRDGRLRPGDRLPGARTLAAQLGVHRHTVDAAMRELRAQGWLESQPRSGVRVAVSLPVVPFATTSPAPLRRPLPDRPAPRMPRLTPPARLTLEGGRPDLRLLPIHELTAAWRRALRGGGRRLLDYGDPQGHRALREVLGAWLRDRRGLKLEPEGLLITRGAQQALFLTAMACFSPGDRVAVEALGYAPCWEAFRAVGVHLVPIPVDPHGIDVDALARADVQGVYLTPHHQYPTMVPLSPARRQALLQLAYDRRMLIVEDDYDHELHYAGSPRLPLAHADPHGLIVYVGTLSKALAPGLRVGFLCAHPEVIRRMTALRVAIDRQGDAVTERAVAEVIGLGILDRHIRHMQRVYADRAALTHALATDALRLPVPRPDGGLSLWAPSPVDPARLRQACEARGVSFRIGADHTFDGADAPFLRLGFSNLHEAELREAFSVIHDEVRRLGGG